MFAASTAPNWWCIVTPGSRSVRNSVPLSRPKPLIFRFCMSSLYDIRLIDRIDLGRGTLSKPPVTTPGRETPETGIPEATNNLISVTPSDPCVQHPWQIWKYCTQPGIFGHKGWMDEPAAAATVGKPVDAQSIELPRGLVLICSSRGTSDATSERFFIQCCLE